MSSYSELSGEDVPEQREVEVETAVEPDCHSRCVTALKEELHLKNFSLAPPCPEVFYLPQWHIPVWSFLFYHIFISFYLLVWLVVSILKQDPDTYPFPWETYVTCWCYLCLTAYMMLASLIGFVCILFDAISDEHSNDMELLLLPDTEEGASRPLLDDQEFGTRTCLDWLFRLDWLLFNLSASSAALISLSYWVFIAMGLGSYSWLPSDIHLHVVNTIVILLEVMLSAIHMQLLHAIYPMIMGIVYVMFSVVFWALDNDRVLYPGVLDWNEPGVAMATSFVLVIVLLPTLHMALWALCKLRSYMYAKIYFRD